MSSRNVWRWLVALVPLLACGCPTTMDPSVYHASKVAAAEPAAGEKPAVVQPAPVAPVAGAQPPAPKLPKMGDIRIMAADPTLTLTAPDNVAIIIEKLGTDQRTATDGSLAFRYTDDSIAVASPGGGLARRNGLRIGVAKSNLGAQVGGAVSRVKSSTREQMFIVVKSGQEGVIQMGEDVLVQRLGYWTPFGYELLLERAFVGRSLAVRPRILPGGLVEVELWPVFSTRGPRGSIALTQLATKLVVRDGQSIVLGGLSTGSDEVAAALFAIGREARSGMMTMILTPKIGGMQLDWPKGKW